MVYCIKEVDNPRDLGNLQALSVEFYTVHQGILVRESCCCKEQINAVGGIYYVSVRGSYTSW